MRKLSMGKKIRMIVALAVNIISAIVTTKVGLESQYMVYVFEAEALVFCLLWIMTEFETV